jgi:hypothetical protein
MRSKRSSLHRDEGAGLNVALIAHNAGGDANNTQRPIRTVVTTIGTWSKTGNLLPTRTVATGNLESG